MHLGVPVFILIWRLLTQVVACGAEQWWREPETLQQVPRAATALRAPVTAPAMLIGAAVPATRSVPVL